MARAAVQPDACNFVTTWTLHNPPYAILKWSIEHFSFAQNPIESARFDVGRTCRWYLLMEPNASDGFVTFRLRMDPNSRPPSRLKIRGEFSVHGPSNVPIFDRLFEEVYGGSGIEFRMPRVCFSAADNYLVRCEMIISREKTVTDEWQPHLEKLSDDLRVLHLGNSFTDAIVRASDGTIGVHKALLTMRSTALAELLAAPGNSVFQNVESSVLSAALTFIYTGNPDLLLDSVPLEVLGTVGVTASAWKMDELVDILTPAKFVCKTHVRCKDFSYTWQLKNFSNLPPEVLSEEFCTDANTGWTLALKKNGNTYGIHLTRRSRPEDSAHEEVDVEFRMWNRKSRHEVRKSSKVDFYPRRTFGIPSFATESYLRSRILKDDILFVDCRLRFRLGTHSRIESQEMFTDVPGDSTTLKYLKTLSRDLRQLCASGRCADVKLWAGQERLDAHKAVLWARSPYFRTQLCHGSEEFVNVPIEGETLRGMLLFVYAAEVPTLDCRNCLKFYKACHVLQLPDLCHVCRRFILGHMNVDIVLEVIKVALELSDHELENAAVDFVCVPGNAKMILNTERWMTFRENYNAIAIRIYHKLAWDFCNHVCIR